MGICKHKQTLSIPLSLVTHAFNNLCTLGPCPGRKLSQQILLSALITWNRNDIASILGDLGELGIFSTQSLPSHKK